MNSLKPLQGNALKLLSELFHMNSVAGYSALDRQHNYSHILENVLF